MNDQTEVLPAPLQQESFDVVLRGYSRGQVDEYVKRIKRQLEDLGNRTAQAEREAGEARRDRDLVRSELTAANQKLERGGPSYEEFGERLTQILALAQQEADEMRSSAQTEAQQIRTEAEEAVGGLRREVEDKQAAAEIEAERLRTEAREEAQRVRTEADESAQQVQREAEERAQRLVSEAEERSSQREQAARDRVHDLESQQTQLLAQLSEVRDSLQTLLPARAAALQSVDAGEPETGEGPDTDTSEKSSTDVTGEDESGEQTTRFDRPGGSST